MAEYPRTVLEFRDWFADDAACRDYLAGLRWPEGFRCPICQGADHWVTARGLRHCRGCGRETSVTAGTLFADTHLPLRLWFEALWHVTSQKSGASALGLQRVLGLGSYRTAWNLLWARLRFAGVRTSPRVRRDAARASRSRALPVAHEHRGQAARWDDHHRQDQ